MTIGPGERFDLEVDGTNPGVWMFHCHINNHAANGMSTVLTYDGSHPFSDDLSMGHGPAAQIAGASEGAMAPMPGGMTMLAGKPVTATPAPASAPSAAPTTAATPSAQAGPAATSSASNIIEMQDNRYAPSKLTVQVGTTVTFKNTGLNTHNATSLTGVWDSGLLTTGQTFQYTFTTPGTYKFICSQHFLEGMTGTLTVSP